MPRARPSHRQTARFDAQDAYLRERTAHQPVQTCLDLGCEHGWVGERLRKLYPHARVVGVDIWPEYVELCRTRGWYDEVIESDVLEFLAPETRWDVIVAGELLEHLTKVDGHRLLDLMWRRTRCASVLTTPIGFMRMRALEGNPHQEHKSGWVPDEVEEYGYATLAVDKNRNFFISGYSRW